MILQNITQVFQLLASITLWIREIILFPHMQLINKYYIFRIFNERHNVISLDNLKMSYM